MRDKALMESVERGRSRRWARALKRAEEHTAEVRKGADLGLVERAMVSWKLALEAAPGTGDRAHCAAELSRLCTLQAILWVSARDRWSS